MFKGGGGSTKDFFFKGSVQTTRRNSEASLGESGKISQLEQSLEG